MTDNRTERIGIRIRKYLKRKLEDLARRDNRSFSNYIELILEKHVKEKESKDKRT